MIRKLFVALTAAAIKISIAITIMAHCGSTWVVQDPSFGPPLGSDGCIAGSNPTTTSKSVSTTIHWTVGPPTPVVVTDFGQNKRIGGMFGDCVRCFPVFNEPQWQDLGNNRTRWQQFTWRQTIGSENQCVQDFTRDPIFNHYERDCIPSQQQCEAEFSWFWNPFSDSCQEEATGVGCIPSQISLSRSMAELALPEKSAKLLFHLSYDFSVSSAYLCVLCVKYSVQII
jgi:hypothetical protein